MEALKSPSRTGQLSGEPIRSKEEAAQAVKAHAHLTAQLGVLIAARESATAALNKQLADILDKRQPAIDLVSGQLTQLQGQLRTWSENNRDKFGASQSLEFSHGFLRFRIGQRKLESLARWTLEKTLKKLKSFPVTSQWREYIRSEEEVNKQKLLAETKDGGRLPAARLKEVGLIVTQDESFSIEPKPDAVAKDCDLMP